MLDPDQLFSAGAFARTARVALQEIAGRERLPVLVGGTGFYLRALLDGLSPAPERQDSLRPDLTERERKRPGSLHRILSRLDPAASARIHPNDVKKVIRALELCLLRRRSVSPALPAPREPLAGFRIIKVGLDPPRAELRECIDNRVARMFESGLLAEVQAILASGVPSSAKPFESLGYSQTLAHLAGLLSLTEAITLAQQVTRQYAKRQMTWFRREPDVHWLNGFGSDPQVQADAISYLHDRLK